MTDNDDTHEDRRDVDPAEVKRVADDDSDIPPEDQAGVPGAEGGSASDAKHKLPGAPSKNDSPLGDTDQHSSG